MPASAPLSIAIAGLITLGVLVPGAAQDLARAQTLLETCQAAAADDMKDASRAIAREAESLFTHLERQHPQDPEPLVGHARVLSQCLLPFAGAFGKADLYHRSTELLERALALDSTHWAARYSLALGHYHVPRFMGRTDDAIREFERLLRQQGDAAEFPEQAGPFAYLGDLYVRKGRGEDAVQLWQRGAALFPDDRRLQRRLNPEARDD